MAGGRGRSLAELAGVTPAAGAVRGVSTAVCGGVITTAERQRA
jgi:hypothetical protein